LQILLAKILECLIQRPLTWPIKGEALILQSCPDPSTAMRVSFISAAWPMPGAEIYQWFQAQRRFFAYDCLCGSSPLHELPSETHRHALRVFLVEMF
jgi:hypothetical protein